MTGAGFDSTRVWDHLHWSCHTLVRESQSPRINFSSGTLIIFNHPAETEARVIDMTSTGSMWGSLRFLSPPPTALTDEFNKRGPICLAENRTAKLSATLLAWFHQYWWIYHSALSQKEPIPPTPNPWQIFKINESLIWLDPFPLAWGKLCFYEHICVLLNGDALNIQMHLFHLIYFGSGELLAAAWW